MNTQDAVDRLARLVGTETAEQLVEHLDPGCIDEAETLIAYGAPPTSVPALVSSLPPGPWALHWLGPAIASGLLHIADPPPTKLDPEPEGWSASALIRMVAGVPDGLELSSLTDTDGTPICWGTLGAVPDGWLWRRYDNLPFSDRHRLPPLGALVQCRRPPVPEPEPTGPFTERVPWWECVDRVHAASGWVINAAKVTAEDVRLYAGTGTCYLDDVELDGTVEVLVKEGDR